MTRISQSIRQDILSGKYARDGKLPGVRQLAEYYSCSRGTISNALRQLSDDGIIRTEHGRGCFLSGTQSPRRTSSRMIGAVLLWESWLEEMEELRDEYLKQGWFVSVYCSSNDLQNPAAERRFLELAAEQNFAGVLITGTPIEPLNSGFYQSLRCSGMKIVHLTNYKNDMTGEAAILPDYRMAGAIACSAAIMRGKKRIVMLSSTDTNPPSSQLRESGVRAMASALGAEILPDIKLADWSEISPEEVLKTLTAYGNLDDIAFLAHDCFRLGGVYDVLRSTGIPENQLPFGISMSDTHKLKNRMNHISFDYRQSIRMAMDYILDENISPLDKFSHIMDPKLVMIS